jgi:hypothetical protein
MSGVHVGGFFGASVFPFCDSIENGIASEIYKWLAGRFNNDWGLLTVDFAQRYSAQHRYADRHLTRLAAGKRLKRRASA